MIVFGIRFSRVVFFIASPRTLSEFIFMHLFFLRNEGIFIFSRKGFMAFIQTQLYYKTLLYLLFFFLVSVYSFDYFFCSFISTLSLFFLSFLVLLSFI